MKAVFKHSPFPFTFCILSAVATFLLDSAPAAAQTKYPKPPETYDVEFRYRIRADRNERIRQFEAMSKFLAKIGFKETPYDDMDLAIFNPDAERMIGKIAGDKGRALLRDSHIQTVLLVPDGFKAPEDVNGRVKVLIQINSGFSLERQRLFGLQIMEILAKFGFKESLAYDHRRYTLLRGTMPFVKVRDLLKDLRTLPSGWFLPAVLEQNLPEPLKQLLPIRLIEVLSEEGVPEPVKPVEPLPPPEQATDRKLSTEVRRILQKEDAKIAPLRVELLYAQPIPPGDDWRDIVRRLAPGCAVEGKLYNIVTLTLPQAQQASTLALLPDVISVRLPRAAFVTPIIEGPKEKEPEPKTKEARQIAPGIQQVSMLQQPNPLQLTKLDQLHAIGRRGTGVRVAIIDTDFTGWERFVGKELPKTTHYVDLTPERNSDIKPEPTYTPANMIGHGTHCALAVRYAAPDANIALVRVAADAPYQIVTAFQYMLGDPVQPVSFFIRREELNAETQLLRTERIKANEQYRRAFDNFDDDEPANQARRNAKAALAELDKIENLLIQKTNRLTKMELDLIDLKGVQIVCNMLGWNSGLALESGSGLSQFLDGRMLRPRLPVPVNQAKTPKLPMWVQPSGDTRGQSWVGRFFDADGNGLMEFDLPGSAPKKGRWTPELNFLAFQPDHGVATGDLPANARVRITMQWREPHDPEISEIEYRQPNALLGLTLFRQRDPTGDKLATDEMELIARSEADPERLHKVPHFGVYEQSIELTLPAGGHYAIQVEGRVPNSTRPGGVALIPALLTDIELRPRIFLEVLDGPTQARGRLVFGDYDVQLGGVAIPSEARSVMGVGALHLSKRPEPFSALGAGPNSEMMLKPDVLVYDQVNVPGVGMGPAKGTYLSAAFAAGMSASLVSGGAPTTGLLRSLRIEPGYIFEIPEGILRR